MTTTLKTTSERAVERTSSVPPQDLDAEAALLGAMLLSDAAAAAGVEMLSHAATSTARRTGTSSAPSLYS